ncbi:hypothetical protein ACH4PU_12210 [Streptomyces sp. NPDC021100]|uniref:hypothetical protein n=1 Tax=Streptomyces sp. NPDC021100 TaxID=3365114 RepID=UPI0037BAFC50
MRKTFAKGAAVAAAVAALGLGLAGTASADVTASSGCTTGSNTLCTSASIPTGPSNEVCYSGAHTSVAWGRAEVWDADTGVMVGSVATNFKEVKRQCIHGLYGQHYYLKGTGDHFSGQIWNY